MSQAGVVTMKAMVQRLNRRLERDSKVLRSPRGDVDRSRFGNYFIVDTIRNVVVHAKLSPRQLEEKGAKAAQWPSRLSVEGPVRVGLGRAKTSAVAPHIEISPSNCISGSQIILHTRGSMPCWRIVFSTFRGCMSFYTARVRLGHSAMSAQCPDYPRKRP
jgi:hypothetical protein